MFLKVRTMEEPALFVLSLPLLPIGVRKIHFLDAAFILMVLNLQENLPFFRLLLHISKIASALNILNPPYWNFTLPTLYS